MENPRRIAAAAADEYEGAGDKADLDKHANRPDPNQGAPDQRKNGLFLTRAPASARDAPDGRHFPEP